MVALLSVAGFAQVFGAAFAKPAPMRIMTAGAGLIIGSMGVILVRALWDLSPSAATMLSVWGSFTILAGLGLPVLAAERPSTGAVVMSGLIALALILLIVWPSVRYVARHTSGLA